MSKAEKFIEDYTKNCSNVFINTQLGSTEENHPWLTPNQARRAVEIAREEMIEKACDFLFNTLGLCVPYYDDNDNFHAHGSRTIIIEKLHKTLKGEM